jgi:hypothetical protein
MWTLPEWLRSVILFVLTPVRHALELDHSPSRSLIGSCPCKTCSRARAEG